MEASSHLSALVQSDPVGGHLAVLGDGGPQLPHRGVGVGLHVELLGPRGDVVVHQNGHGLAPASRGVGPQTTATCSHNIDIAQGQQGVQSGHGVQSRQGVQSSVSAQGEQGAHLSALVQEE